jgi:hypothetical protein
VSLQGRLAVREDVLHHKRPIVAGILQPLANVRFAFQDMSLLVRFNHRMIVSAGRFVERFVPGHWRSRLQARPLAEQRRPVHPKEVYRPLHIGVASEQRLRLRKEILQLALRIHPHAVDVLQHRLLHG